MSAVKQATADELLTKAAELYAFDNSKFKLLLYRAADARANLVQLQENNNYTKGKKAVENLNKMLRLTQYLLDHHPGHKEQVARFNVQCADLLEAATLKVESIRKERFKPLNKKKC